MSSSPQTWLKFYEPGVPHHLTYPNDTIDSLLVSAAKKYPTNTATNFILRYIIGEAVAVGGKLTYKQLNTMAENFAASLYDLGVRKGDRVSLMMPNSPHFIIAFFAAMKIGAVIVNTNPTYTGREIKHQVNDSGSETVILLNLFYPRLQEVIADTSLKRVVVAHIHDTLPFPFNHLVRSKQQKEPDWVDVAPAPNVYFFGDLLTRHGNKAPKIELSPDDIALLQYTGGTTGLPKGAMLTHRNILANVMQTRAWQPRMRNGNEKIMSAIPFFHVYGMTVCMLVGVQSAAEMVIVPNPRPIENVMNIISHERCTIFPGVPAMYIGIVNHPKLAEYDLSSVEVCISGSAALPIEIQDKFAQLTGGRLVEGYGMTEASPVTHCNPVYGERRSGSIGIPYPDTEAKLIDLENGSDIPFGENPDQIGELCVRGPQVMKGYWQQPEATANTIDREGWLHTGDVCKMDKDGYYYIVDRKKDMINVSGLKVLPRDVEEVLFVHPKILEVVVVGVPNPKRGDDTLKAYIVLKPNNTATADEIKEFCRQSLAPFKIPREIEFRNELPKTQVGKVLRRVLIDEEKKKSNE
jgi:long-chain acyl-CoA synthetase